MVIIDESTLLVVAGLVFIPVFIFCIKMIIEMGTTKNRLESFESHVKESKDLFQRILTFESDVKSLKQDFHNRFARQDEMNDRLNKEIDMLNQFSYGTKSKSTPAYMSGEDETQAHRDQAGEGLYSSPDSEETQKEKMRKKKKKIRNEEEGKKEEEGDKKRR